MVAFATPASANLIVNGGFETGDFTGWTQADNTALTGVSAGAAYSGNFGAYMAPPDSTGTLYQEFATVAGAFYDLTFYLRNSGGGTGPNVDGEPVDFRVAFAGNFVPGGDVSDVGSSFTQYTFTVQATSTSTRLEFVFRNDSDVFNLDDVSVELHQTSGVPETGSSAWLMALALAGLFGAHRIFGRAARHVPA